MAPANDGIDWDLVQERYYDLRVELVRFRLITPDDIERYKLSRLTFGLIESDLPDLLRNETVIEDADPDRYNLWNYIAYRLSFSDDLAQVVPREYLEPRIDHFAIVEDALQNHTISTQFLASWAELNEIYGRFSTLWATADLDRGLIRAQIGGAEDKSILIQKHWYAHWMQANAQSLKSSDRQDEEPELALLCEDIVKEKVAPWRPYDVDWYSRMITTNDVDDNGAPLPGATYDLTTGLRRLSEAKLKGMLAHDTITPKVLPPLDRSEFDTVAEQRPPGGRATEA